MPTTYTGAYESTSTVLTNPTIYTSLSEQERTHIRQHSPPDHKVYARFGLSLSEGIGLNAVPSRYKTFTSRMAYVHLIHLVIVGSPLRALSGIDIVASIAARFPNLACIDGTPLNSMTVCTRFLSNHFLMIADRHQKTVERMLKRDAVFGQLPCARTVPPLQRIWFNSLLRWSDQVVLFGPLKHLRRYQRLVEQGRLPEINEKRKHRKAVNQAKVRL